MGKIVEQNVDGKSTGDFEAKGAQVVLFVREEMRHGQQDRVRSGGHRKAPVGDDSAESGCANAAQKAGFAGQGAVHGIQQAGQFLGRVEAVFAGGAVDGECTHSPLHQEFEHTGESAGIETAVGIPRRERRGVDVAQPFRWFRHDVR